MAQSLLRQMMVVEPGIAQERGLQFLSGTEVVGAQQIGDATVEALDHAVGLRVLRLGQSMLDAQFSAELVEGVFPRRGTFARGDKAVGELLAIVGQEGADVERRGLGQRRQKTLGVGRRLGGIYGDEDPAGGSVDGHEQVAPSVLVHHLRQVLHIDMNEAGYVGLEGLGLGFVWVIVGWMNS